MTKAQVRRGLAADQGAAPGPGRKGASDKAPIKVAMGQTSVEGAKGLSQALGVAEEKKERGAVMRRAAVVCDRAWAEVAKAAVIVKDQKKKEKEEADAQLQDAVALSEAALVVEYARNFSRVVENSLTKAGGPDEDLPPLEDAEDVAESGLGAQLVEHVATGYEGALGAAVGFLVIQRVDGPSLAMLTHPSNSSSFLASARPGPLLRRAGHLAGVFFATPRWVPVRAATRIPRLRGRPWHGHSGTTPRSGGAAGSRIP